MALSGNFQYLPDGKFGVYCEWSGRQNAEDKTLNRTYITINIYVRHYNINVGSRTGSYRIGSNTGSVSIDDIYDMSASSWHYTKVGSCSGYVYHADDGTASGVSLSVTYPFRGTYSGTYYENITASTSVTLDTIPRRANITQTLSSRTETALSISWSTDATVDKAWYSTDNGSTYTEVTISEGTSGAYTITGLTAGTTYQVKTKVRRKDSQLTSESTAGSYGTYAYPYANVTPDFALGDSVTIGIFNPMGRSVTVKMLKGSTEIGSYTTSGTSVSGFNTSSMVDALYATIPSAQSGQYKISVVYGTTNTTTVDGGTFTVKPSVCAPTIGSLTYQDINPTSVAITGDDQDIVRLHSIVQYTASGLVGNKSATIASASLAVNGNTYALTISGSSATGGNASIDSAMDVVATVTVTDSRGISSTADVTVDMLDWTIPNAILTIQRQNNFYSETDFKVDANYAYINGNNTITITYTCTRQDGGGTPVTGSLSDNVTSVVLLNNDYAWDIQIVLVDGFGGTVTYNTSISRGMPIVYFDRLKNSMSINCFPQEEYTIEVPEGNLQNTISYSTTATDLNDLTVPRHFYGDASNFSHAPVASGDFILEVLNTGAMVRQKFQIGSDEYVRYYDGSSWGNWTKNVASIDDLKTALVDLFYPVGSIYTSTSSTSPATLFGGTWVQIKDTFLLTAGDTYTAGDTGGEATHTLQTSEVPSHSHTGKYINGDGANSGSVRELRVWSASGDGTDTITNSVGGGQAHNNMPPYLVVYAWQRTA